MKYTWRIVGHEKITKGLEDDIASGNIAHAYLFSGPEKVGKYTVAKTFAGILQCEDGNFCHTCKTCQQIEKEVHPDTIVFRDDGESILIDKKQDDPSRQYVNFVYDRLNLSSPSRYKIFIVENIERMTDTAANKLLKILEEPPRDTLFLFTTIYPTRVLPTILSRMRILKFHHCPEDILTEHLKKLYPETSEEAMQQVVKFSLGKPGIAFDLLSDPASITYMKNLYTDLQRFLDYDGIFERFLYIKEAEGNPIKMNDILDVLTHILRSRLISGKGGPKYTDLLDQIDKTKYFLKQNVNAKLALENLMLNL